MIEDTLEILVVDDDDKGRMAVSEFLRTQDFVVHEAENVDNAFQKASRFKPKLVVTDLKMPGPYGFKLIERMKREANLKNIPIIVMSALGDKEHVLQAVKQGAIGFVVKPIEFDDLMKKVNAALGRKT